MPATACDIVNIHSKTSVTTVGNTTTEANLVSFTIPKTAFNNVGKNVRFRVWGQCDASLTPKTLRVRTYLNNVVLLDTGAGAAIGGASILWWLLGDVTTITTGSTGTVEAAAYYRNPVAGDAFMGTTAPVTINLTTSGPQFKVTAEWSLAEAANTISARLALGDLGGLI